MSPNDIYLQRETVNGTYKRLMFIAKVIETHQPRTVLDIGCGTGSRLTVLLAMQFPKVQFIGIDSDPVSIDHARTTYTFSNLEFQLSSELPETRRFDMVIASEVIEHVEEPYMFLADIRQRLHQDGVMVVTMPNGFGPYELTAIFEAVLHIIGIIPMFQMIKRRVLAGKRNAGRTKNSQDTLACSPHINWFSLSRIQRIIHTSGFNIVRHAPRVFLCGLGLQHLLVNDALRIWNAKVADKLPLALSSGWMFVATKDPDSQAQPITYRRSPYEAFRRFLSEKRWSQA